MIVLLIAIFAGIGASWFAIEGLKRRVERLEGLVGDQSDFRLREPHGLVSLETAPAAQPGHTPHPPSPATVASPEILPHRRSIGVFIQQLIDQGEWERAIGGSWLNKLGVLVFVIGLGLLLRYSFGHIGPAGRLCAGLAISISMLAGGVILERRREYAVYYGRGLIGGGWAALYFTTYAAHGIEAVRVIADPLLASVLLLIVAVAMIIHSLLYRSEAATGLAYFAAFATLAITPMTEFAVVASIPLAASLLLIAGIFEWQGMALLGVVITYATYVFSVAGVAPSSSAFLVNQSGVTVYWLTFEAFDLAGLTKRRNSSPAENAVAIALFPLNACGYIGSSLLRWNPATPIHFYLAGSAMLFLVDALIRARIQPPAGEARITLERAARSYEASLTVAAVLAAAGAMQRFSGLKLDLVLVMEAEMLIIAGQQLQLAFPRMLGSFLIVFPVFFLLILDSSLPGMISIAGLQLRYWSFLAFIIATVLYLDRWLTSDRWRSGFGFAGAVVLATIVGIEMSTGYVGLAWLVLGTGLFEAGLATDAADVRSQGYGAIGLGLIALAGAGILGSYPNLGLVLCAGAFLLYAISLRLSQADARHLADLEAGTLRSIVMAGGSVVTTIFLWRELPMAWVAIGWSFFGLVLMIAGVHRKERGLRLQSCMLAMLTFSRTSLVNFDMTSSHFRFSDAVVSSVAVIAVLYVSALFAPRTFTVAQETIAGPIRRVSAWIDAHAREIFGVLAIVLLTWLIYRNVNSDALTEAWALEGLPLLVAGFLRRDRLLRLSGLLLLGGCIVKVFLYDLRTLDTVARIVSFMVLGLLLLGASLVYARWYDRLKPLISGSRGEQ